jgi:hypothetical protein
MTKYFPVYPNMKTFYVIVIVTNPRTLPVYPHINSIFIVAYVLECRIRGEIV